MSKSMLTDMQEVSIRSYMFCHGITLKELTRRALGREVSDIDKLSYVDAILVLNHAKDL